MSLAAAGLVFGLAKPAAAILTVNLFSYLAATAGAFLLGRWLYGPAVGLAAAALLAVWPNLVLGVSGVNKELPALGLLTAAVALYVCARRRNRGRIEPANLTATFACGLCLGMASLVQPALMFLPSAVLLAEVLQPSTVRAAITRLLVVIAGMVVVVAPWSMRNADQLGATVPIATNGGDVLYRANNPRAVPGYLAAGPVNLQQYPEVERSRLGVRLALDWIAQEPHRFLVLSWQRLLHFSGDNSTSAYDAFRRDESDLKPRFVALKGVSNAAWLALWVLILVGFANGSLQSAKEPGAWLLILSYLYVAAMDSIAESGARHHVPFAGLLAVLAASVLCGRPTVAEQATANGRPSGAVQFVDFAAVGAVGTAAQFAILILLVQSIGWPPALATTAGFLVGAAVNYGLNYHLTFQSRAHHAVAVPRFLAIALASMLLNVAIVWALVHWQTLHYLLGQVVATTVVLAVNFVANRALTFGPPRSA
jgi:putative flippase GtrA